MRTSACRPARLLRFGDTLGAVADGLARRRGALDDALAAYRARCDVDHRVPTVDTADVVRAFGVGLRDFGVWVADVGLAFQDAIGSGEHEYGRVYEFCDGDIRENLVAYHLEAGEDPFRGVPAGAAAALATELGRTFDPDGPPSWVAYLAAGGNVGNVTTPVLKGAATALRRLPEYAPVTFRIEGGVAVVDGKSALAARFAAELSAELRLPVGQASHLARAAKWSGRLGTAMTGAAGTAGQWFADAGLDTPFRLARAGTRGGALAGGSYVGAAVAPGLLCGPGAPVCGAITGIIGGVAGGYLADQAADHLPWMHPAEPAEHDLGHVRREVAGRGAVVPEVAAAVDLRASDLALAATADQAPVHDQVARLLPDRDLLERVVATGGDDPQPPTTTTGTTVPARHPDGGVPDPWVAPRFYE